MRPLRNEAWSSSNSTGRSSVSRLRMHNAAVLTGTPIAAWRAVHGLGQRRIDQDTQQVDAIDEHGGLDIIGADISWSAEGHQPGVPQGEHDRGLSQAGEEPLGGTLAIGLGSLDTARVNTHPTPIRSEGGDPAVARNVDGLVPPGLARDDLPAHRGSGGCEPQNGKAQKAEVHQRHQSPSTMRSGIRTVVLDESAPSQCMSYEKKRLRRIHLWARGVKCFTRHGSDACVCLRAANPRESRNVFHPAAHLPQRRRRWMPHQPAIGASLLGRLGRGVPTRRDFAQPSGDPDQTAGARCAGGRDAKPLRDLRGAGFRHDLFPFRRDRGGACPRRAQRRRPTNRHDGQAGACGWDIRTIRRTENGGPRSDFTVMIAGRSIRGRMVGRPSPSENG
ncbi:hypothetical protein [Azospirillum argentinense]